MHVCVLGSGSRQWVDAGRPESTGVCARMCKRMFEETACCAPAILPAGLLRAGRKAMPFRTQFPAPACTPIPCSYTHACIHLHAHGHSCTRAEGMFSVHPLPGSAHTRTHNCNSSHTHAHAEIHSAPTQTLGHRHRHRHRHRSIHTHTHAHTCTQARTRACRHKLSQPPCI